MLMTYCDLKNESLASVVCLEGVENRRKLLSIEFNCEQLSVSHFHCACSSSTLVIAIRSLMSSVGRIFQSLTIHYGTDDLMDLAMDSSVARESSS